MKKTKILSVCGPTASGKSDFSIRIALALRDRGIGAEIVSCDSMQIYRGMDVGTGKIKPEEMQGVPHHLLDIADPWESFSLSDFAALAHDAIDRVTQGGSFPILCGGTGLYLDNVLYDTVLCSAPEDAALRRELSLLDSEELHRRLALADPESAAAIHKNNRKRVIRALEIYLVTGVPKSVWDARSRTKQSRYDALRVCLVCSNRDDLYDRINRRVDAMFEAGLEEEVRKIFDAPVSPTAAQAIGYKEFLPYFKKEISLTEVRERIKQASRNYAKRQLTWFCGQDTDALMLDCALLFEQQSAPVMEQLEGWLFKKSED